MRPSRIFKQLLLAIWGLIILVSAHASSNPLGRESVYSNYSFSFRLFSVLDSSESNILVSPQSVGSALYLLAISTQLNSQKEILGALGINSNVKSLDKREYSFLHNPAILEKAGIHSSLAVPKIQEVDPKFNNRLRNLPNFGVIRATLDNINNWVAETSGLKTTNFMSFLAPSSSYALINFSNHHIFSDKESIPIYEVSSKVFNVKEDQSIKTDFLSFPADLSHISANGFDAYLWEQPNSDIKYYIFMPRTNYDINNLTKRFNAPFFNSLVKELSLSPTKQYILHFPTLKINSRGSLKLPLQGIGIFDVFSSEGANFIVSSFGSRYLTDVYYDHNLRIPKPEDFGAPTKKGIFNPLDLFLDRPFFLVVAEGEPQNISLLVKVLNPAL